MKRYAELHCNGVETRIKSLVITNLGSWPVTINPTDDTISEWTEVISTFNDRQDKNLSMWWVVWSPYLTKSFYVVAEPPQQIPMSDMSQNELQTVEIGLTINEFKGMDTAIRPTDTI